jgi:hypothetical protein
VPYPVTAYRHRERVPLAVTIGAGFGCAVCVAVTVAATVTVGFTLSAVGFSSVPLFWPSARQLYSGGESRRRVNRDPLPRAPCRTAIV